VALVDPKSGIRPAPFEESKPEKDKPPKNKRAPLRLPSRADKERRGFSGR
jgi:hypothetical protein